MYGFQNKAQAINAQGLRDFGPEAFQEILETQRVQHLQDGAVHLIGTSQVFIGGRDHRPVRVFQPVQPVFQPVHRDAAQIDDIGPHRAPVGRDQRIHHVDIFQQGFGFRDDAVTQVLFDHKRGAFGRVTDMGQLCAPCSILSWYTQLQRIFCPVFAQSFINCSNPLSVSTWEARPLITAGGAVITSAPMRAHSVTWFAVRMEAARIWVLKS